MPRVRLDDDEDEKIVSAFHPEEGHNPLVMEHEGEELPEEETEEEDNYFSHQKSSLEFIPSGAAPLDCTLGGGWAMTRIANLIGDESTGKTLLAMEACANFLKKWPRGKAYYREAESAFDEAYAEALGMPVDKIDFIGPEDDFETVEDFHEDLMECIAECKRRKQPGLYVLDSLDSLSDKAEMKTGFDEGSYGMAKAKLMSKLFRMVRKEITEANMCLLIVSQTRAKVGGMHPGGKTRAGGKGLDFYASQIIWLSPLKPIEMTRNKVKREVGVRIRAKCSKNKIALPHRQCEFAIRFGLGVDNVESCVEWLEANGEIQDAVGVSKETYVKRLAKMSDEEYWQAERMLDGEVRKRWVEIEDRFIQEVRRRPR